MPEVVRFLEYCHNRKEAWHVAGQYMQALRERDLVPACLVEVKQASGHYGTNINLVFDPEKITGAQLAEALIETRQRQDCRNKETYPTPAKAREAAIGAMAQFHTALEPYECPACRAYHLKSK